MEIKRKIEMLVATSEKYVIRKPSTHKYANCAKCGAHVLTAGQAAAMFGITQRRIFQIIETGAAHFAEDETGAAMICITSLTIFLEADERK